jgi:hypothetical protein
MAVGREPWTGNNPPLFGHWRQLPCAPQHVIRPTCHFLPPFLCGVPRAVRSLTLVHTTGAVSLYITEVLKKCLLPFDLVPLSTCKYQHRPESDQSLDSID